MKMLGWFLLAAVACGALGSTIIDSAGYDAEDGAWGAVGMFGVLLAATGVAIGRLLRAAIAPRRGDGAAPQNSSQAATEPNTRL
jgi:hypothetical protein